MMLNDLKPRRHNSDDTVMPLSQTIRHRLNCFYLLSLQQNKHCKQQSSSKLSKLKMIVVEKMIFDQSSKQASICSRLGRILTGCSPISFFFYLWIWPDGAEQAVYLSLIIVFLFQSMTQRLVKYSSNVVEGGDWCYANSPVPFRRSVLFLKMLLLKWWEDVVGTLRRPQWPTSTWPLPTWAVQSSQSVSAAQVEGGSK